MRFLPLVALSLIAAEAYAGAWTEPQNSSQIILTGSYYDTSTMFDNKAHKESQPEFSKYELNPYMEYGLRDDLTVGANLSLQAVHQEAYPGGTSQSNWGVGDSVLFLRQRLWQQNGFVVSAEPMIKIPAFESSTDQPKLGGSSADVGMGLSGGYGFTLLGLNDFADIDTEYRHRFGTPHDQANFAATLGVSVTPEWMIMPQSFFTYRLGFPKTPAFTNSSGDDYNLVKAQLSAVYKLSSDISLQGGGFWNVTGRNAGDGGGVLFAVWKRF